MTRMGKEVPPKGLGRDPKNLPDIPHADCFGLERTILVLVPRTVLGQVLKKLPFLRRPYIPARPRFPQITQILRRQRKRQRCQFEGSKHLVPLPPLHDLSPTPRFYLIAGGIPLIICGITAAVNIHNYRDHSP